MADNAAKPELELLVPSGRPPRRNLNRIHALPLPLQTYPVPAFHPTNPLSILFVLQQLLGPYLFPSSYHSHPKKYTAYLSTGTGNIVVTNPVDIRALWERGFFGKGSLSRSEPEWLEKEKKRRVLDTPGLETSEEVTRSRREARREEKRERARKDTEAIENQLRAEGKLPSLPYKDFVEPILAHEHLVEPVHGGVDGHTNGNARMKTVDPRSRGSLDTRHDNFDARSNGVLKSVHFEDDKTDQVTKRVQTSENRKAEAPLETQHSKTHMITQEHLQLMPEEALFLAYGLGVLDIVDRTTSQVLTTTNLMKEFRRRSYFPPAPPERLHPDDPFLVSYVVYHHFRSLGWIVRSGIKFAADWLLYYRGPAFSHAEFAVFILPSYVDPYWTATPELVKQSRAKETKNWWWLHAANRVQGHVKKTAILVYVEIPPPKSIRISDHADIGALLRSYRIHEFALRRWTANRSRKGR